MDSQHDEAAEREQRLQEVLVAYLEAAEADRAPEAEELLARYPEFVDELAEFLASRDQIDQLAAPLRKAVEIAQKTIAGDAPTIAPGGTLPPQVDTTVRYFGKYELLEEIARGGMGVVFRARQTTVRKPYRVVLRSSQQPYAPGPGHFRNPSPHARQLLKRQTARTNPTTPIEACIVNERRASNGSLDFQASARMT